jgi:hypothetical protein
MESTVLYNRINSLPAHIKEEVLDFMEFLLEKSKKQGTIDSIVEPYSGVPPRRLGLLEKKASFKMKEDFKMTDEEFLSI